MSPRPCWLAQGMGAPGAGPPGWAPNLGPGRACCSERMGTGTAPDTGSVLYVIWDIAYPPGLHGCDVKPAVPPVSLAHLVLAPFVWGEELQEACGQRAPPAEL